MVARQRICERTFFRFGPVAHAQEKIACYVQQWLVVDVLQVADQLLARNVPCTPTNVSAKLKRLIEPKRIAAILRQRRKQFGRNTSQLLASIPEFEAWAVASSNDYEADLRVARYEIRPEVRAVGPAGASFFGRSYRNFFQNPFWMWRSGLTWQALAFGNGSFPLSFLLPLVEQAWAATTDATYRVKRMANSVITPSVMVRRCLGGRRSCARWWGSILLQA